MINPKGVLIVCCCATVGLVAAVNGFNVHRLADWLWAAKRDAFTSANAKEIRPAGTLGPISEEEMLKYQDKCADSGILVPKGTACPKLPIGVTTFKLRGTSAQGSSELIEIPRPSIRLKVGPPPRILRDFADGEQGYVTLWVDVDGRAWACGTCLVYKHRYSSMAGKITRRGDRWIAAVTKAFVEETHVLDDLPYSKLLVELVLEESKQ